MLMYARRVITIALFISLAACGQAGNSSGKPTAHSTATAQPRNPCAIRVSSPQPPPQSAAPIVPVSGSDSRFLRKVAMVSASEGWAVGGIYVPNSEGNGLVSADSLLLHYINGKWTQVQSPTNHFLYSLQMLSTTEGWAVGDGGVILHYHGGQWSIDTTIQLPSYIILTDIFMLSPNEGWAVGDGGVIVHYIGGQWTLVSQNGSSIFSVSMVSPDEGWAGGWFDNGGSVMFYHYQTGSWTNVTQTGQVETTANTDTGPILSIAMVSATEGWAEGTGVWHYCAGKWSEVISVKQLGGAVLSGVVLSPHEGWAVGSIIWHFSNGQWTSVKSPVPLAAPPGAIAPYHVANLLSISMISPDEGWAIGDGINISSPSQSQYTGYFFLHYLNGVWTLYAG